MLRAANRVLGVQGRDALKGVHGDELLPDVRVDLPLLEAQLEVLHEALFVDPALVHHDKVGEALPSDNVHGGRVKSLEGLLLLSLSPAP